MKEGKNKMTMGMNYGGQASIEMTMDTIEEGMMVILMTTNTNEEGRPSSM